MDGYQENQLNQLAEGLNIEAQKEKENMPGKINNGVPNGAVGLRKKVSKRRPKKGLRSYVKAVARYLVSDTYMYAPLVEEASANRRSTSLCPEADGTPSSHLSTEALRKIGAKLSAKRILYEEYVEQTHS